MLELKNVSFSVDDGEKLDILRDINLKLSDTGIFLITGPNGGGKTSLAKLIMGINKPTSGRILLDGEDITDLDVTERAKRGIGYAFQTPPRFKGLTVSRLLSLAAGREMSDDSCCSILSKVGLCPKEYLSRSLDSSLSGGEMKRIEVASLLARQPKVAIYDEPEAGIDLWSFKLLVDTFASASESQKCCIVIISHQERIMQLADTILLVGEGQLLKVGKREEMLPIISGYFEQSCKRLTEKNESVVEVIKRK